MVSLPLMARLLDGLRPEARLVLVGDPYQLASIEAGTVLGDLVGPAGEPSTGDADRESVLAGRVTVLRRMHRFGADSAIAALAETIRRGDADAVVDILGAGHPDVRWVLDTDRAGVDEVRGQLVEAGVDLAASALRRRCRGFAGCGRTDQAPGRHPARAARVCTTGMTGSKPTSAPGCRSSGGPGGGSSAGRSS